MRRLPFLDWTRGFAVVAMVLWHTGDGWLRTDQRSGELWLALRFVGGLAAPGFLFLAGCAAALANRSPNPPGTLRKNLSRALEVWLIGYVLRLQTWLVDAGALIEASTMRAWLPLGAGYAVLFWSARQLNGAPRRATQGALLGLALAGIGLLQVESIAPGRFAKLLQVDVLQAIGASLALLSLAQRAVGLLNRPAWLVGLSLLVAAATSTIAQAMPGPLPHALAGYLGKFTPSPGATPASLFPLFPWLAYALAGAAVGALFARARDRAERLTVTFAVLGACLALLTSEAQPFVHQALSVSPWLAAPVRMLFRVGLVLTLLMVGWIWTGPERGRFLVVLGQTSLRIYWAHMLFAYGVLGRALQGRLSFLPWFLWLSPLFLALWWLAKLGQGRPQTTPSVVRT